MQNNLITLIITVIGGVIVLFFEYFFLGLVDATARKRILVAVLLSFSSFVPLVLIQLVSVQFVAATMRQRPEAVRVDWYANLYAVTAMLWGWLWGAKVRPWLRSIFEPEG